MKLVTLMLALLGLFTIALACNDDEEKCCGSRYGCTCKHGKWKYTLYCGRGNFCQIKDGQMSCKRKHLLSGTDNEDVAAVPNDPASEPVAPIEIPDDTAPTKSALSDIAAVIETTAIVARDTADTSKVMCGSCINMQGRRSELTGIGVCNTLANDEKYRACSNQYCGVCMIFRDKGCQGDVLHWGGPGAGSYDATGGQSHYCI